MIFKVSTTGIVSSVPLPDLGLRTLEHPTIELDLGLEYSDDELLSSVDLENAIINNWLVVTEKSGSPATQEYVDEQLNTVSGSLYNLIAVQTALATVQLDRTTDYTIETTWANVTFDTVSYENLPDVLEHDDINTERILVKDTGTYSFSYGMVVQANNTTTYTYGRLLKNGIDEISASDSEIRTYQGERHELTGSVTADIESGTYITLQLRRSSEGTVTGVHSRLNAIKLDGVKGEKGDVGDQGPPGLVTVSGSAYFDAYDSAGTLVLDANWQDVPFNVIRKNSGEFTFTNNTELIIPVSNTYHITTRITADITSGTNRSESIIRLVKDNGSGYIEIPGSIGALYHRLLGEGSNTATVTILDDFEFGDKIKVQIRRDSGSDTISLLANGSSISVHIPAGMPGKDGIDGEPGAPGSGSTITLKDEGTVVANAPHSILNFVGSGVSVSDAGSGQADITIDSGFSGITIQDEGTPIVGGPHHTINFTGAPVSTYDLGSGVAGVWVQPPTFGTWYAWDGDETETNTNSDSPIQKASLSVVSVAAGYYRIGWYYEWRRNTASNDYRASIVLDGTTTLMEHAQEAQDVNSWHTQAGFYIVNLSNANHTFVFNHYGESTGNTSYTRRVRLEIWRVA
jgi:hypothetical protein